MRGGGEGGKRWVRSTAGILYANILHQLRLPSREIVQSKPDEAPVPTRSSRSYSTRAGLFRRK